MKKKAATFFFSSRVWQIWDTYKKCIKSCFQKILKGFLFWCNILVLTEPNRERNHLILSWIAPPTSANNLDYSQHKSSKYLVNHFSQPVSNGLNKICTSTYYSASDEGFGGFVLQIHRFYRLRADSLTGPEHCHQQTADYFRESWAFYRSSGLLRTDLQSICCMLSIEWYSMWMILSLIF